jgi:hypothetical protein
MNAFVDKPLLFLPHALSLSFTGRQITPLDDTAVFGNPGWQLLKQREGPQPGSCRSEAVHVREETANLFVVGLPGQRQLFREFREGLLAVSPAQSLQGGSGGAKLVLPDHPLNLSTLMLDRRCPLRGSRLLLTFALVCALLLLFPRALNFSFAVHEVISIDNPAILGNPGRQILKKG